MFQFHTRVVSGTLGRMPLYSFLFQTQCEVFNFNILCNYNGYKAYIVLIHPHLFLVLSSFRRGTKDSLISCILHTLKYRGRKLVGRDWQSREKEFGAGHPELNPLNVATGFATGVLSSHMPSPRVQVMASGQRSSSPICHLGFLSSSLAPGHLPQELALSLW